MVLPLKLSLAVPSMLSMASMTSMAVFSSSVT